jgi:GT2 family glycosyltransferase
MRCSIIIVSWNGLKWLQKFLPGLLPVMEFDCEIIVADNASEDESVDWVTSNCPGVRIITLDKNYGYCGGNNRAARFAKGELLFFLNNDVQMDPNSLVPLLEAFQDDSIGAVQPKILSFNKPSHFEYAGAAGGYLDPFGYPYCKGRIFDTCEPDLGQYDSKEPIFWASGAALMIRKELFERCSGFEEAFEFHMEEIDLCWKVQRLGYNIICVHQSVVYHVGGGSLDEGSPRKLRYNVRNNLLMLTMHLSLLRILFVYPSRKLLDFIAAIKELTGKRPGHCLAIFQGHVQYLTYLPSFIKKRRQYHLLFKDKHPIKVRNIVLPWQYFVRSRRRYQDLPDRFTNL